MKHFGLSVFIIYSLLTLNCILVAPNQPVVQNDSAEHLVPTSSTQSASKASTRPNSPLTIGNHNVSLVRPVLASSKAVCYLVEGNPPSSRARPDLSRYRHVRQQQLLPAGLFAHQLRRRQAVYGQRPQQSLSDCAHHSFNVQYELEMVQPIDDSVVH